MIDDVKQESSLRLFVELGKDKATFFIGELPISDIIDELTTQEKLHFNSDDSDDHGTYLVST